MCDMYVHRTNFFRINSLTNKVAVHHNKWQDSSLHSLEEICLDLVWTLSNVKLCLMRPCVFALGLKQNWPKMFIEYAMPGLVACK